MDGTAQHEVDEQYADAGLRPGGADARGAVRRVDHGVRPTDGELIGAKVDHLVHGRGPIERAEEGLQQQARLLCQGASGVEAEQGGSAPLRGPGAGQASAHDGRIGERIDVDGPAAGQRHRGHRGRLQRADPMAGGRGGRDAPEAAHHDGLAERGDDRVDLPHDPRRRRLRDQDDDLGCWIRGQQLEAERRHQPAHRLGQIATAHADPVRDSLAEGGHVGGDGLQACAGGGHAADPAARDDVGEAESHAPEVRGAAVRAHAQEPAAGGEPFEGHLVLDGHVVAEQEYVEALAQCRPRLAGGLGSGHGHERQVGLGELTERRLEGAGSDAAGGLARAPLLVEERPGRRERRLCSLLALRVDGEHQVGRPRVIEAARGEARVREELPVRRRAHERGGLANAGTRAERRRQLHQDHGVLIEGAPDLDPDVTCRRACRGVGHESRAPL